MVTNRDAFKFVKYATGRTYKEIAAAAGVMPTSLQKYFKTDRLVFERLARAVHALGGTVSFTITLDGKTLDLVTGAISQAPQNTKSCPVSEKIFPDATK